MKYRIGILVLILCLLNCSPEKKNIQEIGINRQLYTIDLDEAEKVRDAFLSEICSQMKTIILETNDNVLIKQVGGVQVYKDYIFVLDNSDNAGLYAFNREGTFIRKYGNRGSGPGEYLSIDDFTIGMETGIIYLTNDKAKQILLYDISTGKYIKTIRLEEKAINCLHIQYNNEKLYTDIDYWHNDKNSCILQEIDQSTGKRKQCWLDPQKYNKGWKGEIGNISRMEESFFYARNQEVCKYIPYFSDTIISIGKNQIEPYAVVKEKDWISAKDLSKIIEDSNHDGGRILQAIAQKEISHNIHSYIEWDDFISFYYMKQGDSYFVLYNKKTGKTRTAKYLNNDIGYNKSILVNRFACSDKNGIYEIIGMYAIDMYLERIKEDGVLKPNLDKYEQLKNLPEDTNPVIFYYEFK
jgi:hypothetical protein